MIKKAYLNIYHTIKLSIFYIKTCRVSGAEQWIQRNQARVRQNWHWIKKKNPPFKSQKLIIIIIIRALGFKMRYLEPLKSGGFLVLHPNKPIVLEPLRFLKLNSLNDSWAFTLYHEEKLHFDCVWNPQVWANIHTITVHQGMEQLQKRLSKGVISRLYSAHLLPLYECYT